MSHADSDYHQKLTVLRDAVKHLSSPAYLSSRLVTDGRLKDGTLYVKEEYDRQTAEHQQAYQRLADFDKAHSESHQEAP